MVEDHGARAEQIAEQTLDDGPETLGRFAQAQDIFERQVAQDRQDDAVREAGEHLGVRKPVTGAFNWAFS